MGTVFGLILTIVITASLTISFFSFSDYRDKQKVKKFYDFIEVGDAWKDPFYSNDPFSREHRVIQVVAKKNDYVLYDILWFDSKTNLRSTTFKPHQESLPIAVFYKKVKNYTKTIVWE